MTETDYLYQLKDIERSPLHYKKEVRLSSTLLLKTANDTLLKYEYTSCNPGSSSSDFNHIALQRSEAESIVR